MKVDPFQIIIDTNVILSGLKSGLGASFKLLDLERIRVACMGIGCIDGANWVRCRDETIF